MLDRLDHVIVAVRDLASSCERYAALLGRPVSWRGEHPGAGSANALFRLENTYLELLTPRGEGGVGDMLRARLDAVGEGVLGLAFGTPDADAFVASLRAAGGEVTDPQPGHGRDQDSGALRRWRNAYLSQATSRGPLVFAIEHATPADLLPLREPGGPAESAVRALDHVVVMSKDIDATAALYGDRLGLRLALDRTFPQRGVRLLFFRVGGTTIEIGGSATAKPDPDAPDDLWGLAYQVGDADAARARLARAGFDVTEVRDGNKPGTRVCTVKDGTSGVPTLVIEPVRP